jgi:transcription antitermination factor NusG
MNEFKVGDRVRILSGATHFVGVEGTIHEIRRHDGGIATMDRHIVEFRRREKRSFFCREMTPITKSK